MIKKSKNLIALMLATLMLIGIIIPVNEAASNTMPSGFDKGPSYTSVVPTKKVTFVNYDENEIFDDYAYLAAVPTSVFNYDGTLVSNPLLFYQDQMRIEEDKYLSLDAYTGIKYFMEDWESYCNQMDQMTLINVDSSKVTDWKSKEYTEIESDDPYHIASTLAMQEWNYANDAVVAVINQDFEESDVNVENMVKGSIPVKEVKEINFEVKQSNKLNPVYHEFEVEEGYKYLYVEAWWDGVIFAGKMAPSGDPDIQLYCNFQDDWMQAMSASNWNIYRPIGREYTYSYIYKSGDWKVGVTDFPTKTDGAYQRTGPLGLFSIQGKLLNLIFGRGVTYYVDIEMFPGTNVELPDQPPFGCRSADFKLTWDNPNVNLGFTILGPNGDAIYTMIEDEDNDKSGEKEIHFEYLGECPTDEHYSVSVFSLDKVATPIDFEIEYNWHQNITKEKTDSLTSATEGAVLASSLNAPLLYTSKSSLSKHTKDALLKLGVENIYLVNLGSHLKNDVKEELENIGKIKENYKEPIEIYEAMMEMTNSNDIVFTTIDPWTSWLVAELEPSDEFPGSLFIGPAAYLAAHHGTSVIVIDNHPELTSAATWHNEFWRRFSAQRYDYKPSVAEMVFTGTSIYDFLRESGFDKEGEETIITVAGQYEIGVSWDRIFPGVAHSGRICGTPIDTSVWISRSVFYPALIFENPATQGVVTLETGSESSREGVLGLIRYPYLNSLVINKYSRKVEVEYPVLCSMVGYEHRFNERASKYYGVQYQCANGMTPGVDNTLEPIDQGSIKKYTGLDGTYFPDMSATEVIPFYLEKGGFSPVYSTKLEKVADNLNQGVLLWFHSSHGTQINGGRTLFWDPQDGFHTTPLAGRFSGAYKELNPWRGYDWLLGSTEEPDTMSMDVKGIIPFTNYDPLLLPIPAMGLDWVLARKPFQEWLVERPFLGNFFDRFLNVDNLYDGVIGSFSYSKDATDWKTSLDIEPLLDNLHSAGFVTCICQTSNTYLHLMIIRHGSVFQVQDPWPTSWYSTVWQQSIPRDIALGSTIGEAFSKGMEYVGILYLGGGIEGGPQWWWDDSENVCFFGDPDLRPFVPNEEFSNINHWDQGDTMPLNYGKSITFDGHAPFGASDHPHAKQERTFMQEYLFVLIILVIIVLLLLTIGLIGRKKK